MGASSNDKANTVMAVSYAIAKTNNDQYFINNQKGYATPEYVATLPPRKTLTGGKIVSVDEVSLYLLLSFLLKQIIMTDQENLK